jgi:predicted SprT family Zn-dependent metalloprotease
MTLEDRLRGSTESIDTQDVLIPLLERLGIDVPESLYQTGQGSTTSVGVETISLLDDDDLDSDPDGCVSESSIEVLSERSMFVAGRQESFETNEDVCLVGSPTTCSAKDDLMPDQSLAHLIDDIKAMSFSGFSRQRESLARELYRHYNKVIFDFSLPTDLDISWNKRLISTAGLTHYSRKLYGDDLIPIYTARIELSSKVLDTVDKLERTLVHEMCHCAAWLIDHVSKPAHGAVFKKYANRAMTIVPHIEVTTCHQYAIFHAHRWQCTTCLVEYGRHSNSIDTGSKVCGHCRGSLVYLGQFNRDGSPQKKRVNAYSTFVKENFSRVQKEMLSSKTVDGCLATDVVKRLAEMWKDTQASPLGKENLF